MWCSAAAQFESTLQPDRRCATSSVCAAILCAALCKAVAGPPPCPDRGSFMALQELRPRLNSCARAKAHKNLSVGSPCTCHAGCSARGAATTVRRPALQGGSAVGIRELDDLDMVLSVFTGDLAFWRDRLEGSSRHGLFLLLAQVHRCYTLTLNGRLAHSLAASACSARTWATYCAGVLKHVHLGIRCTQ